MNYNDIVQFQSKLLNETNKNVAPKKKNKTKKKTKQIAKKQSKSTEESLSVDPNQYTLTKYDLYDATIRQKNKHETVIHANQLRANEDKYLINNESQYMQERFNEKQLKNNLKYYDTLFDSNDNELIDRLMKDMRLSNVDQMELETDTTQLQDSKVCNYCKKTIINEETCISIPEKNHTLNYFTFMIGKYYCKHSCFMADASRDDDYFKPMRMMYYNFFCLNKDVNPKLFEEMNNSAEFPYHIVDKRNQLVTGETHVQDTLHKKVVSLDNCDMFYVISNSQHDNTEPNSLLHNDDVPYVPQSPQMYDPSDNFTTTPSYNNMYSNNGGYYQQFMNQNEMNQ